jgi:release factor glutamine methyltransferase
VAADEEASEMLAAAADRATLEAWVARREQGEPLAWIIGRTTFCAENVHVEPGLYVPRYQSEELAVRAAALLPPEGRGADLCTGTGAIAAHLARTVPGALVVATDIDALAARCARRNGARALVGDLGSGLRSGAFDVVTAVTPYVPTTELPLLPADVLRYEPRIALDGGADGLDRVRRLVQEARRLLRVGGWLLTEIGGDQDTAVQSLLDAAGFAAPTFWFDEDGDLRGVAAQLPRPTGGTR